VHRLPARVLSVNDDGSATVDLLGRPQIVLLVLIADDERRPVANGEWLLVQTGLALARIDEAEAAERAALIAETTALRRGGGPQ
jgi:hydrogenase maturation factor